MNGKPSKHDELEVSSGQLQAELIEIKERVGALETIASISNRAVVEAHVRSHVTTDKARQILKECEEPRTREHLKKLGFASAQALDHHLNPLREAHLIRQHFDASRKQTFEWSDLVRRLPKTVLKKILDPGK
jgi:DNA-binding transcriptional ArsR family regulator